MNRTFKIFALIALTAGIWACDEGKYNDLQCDAEYKSNCLDGKNYMICNSGTSLLEVRSCAAGTKCSDDTGEAVCVVDEVSFVCSEASTQCNGNTVQTCIENKWINAAQPCANGCTDGACNTSPTTTCTENTTQCNADGTKIQTCTNNQWVDGDACEHGCEAGACKVVDNTCDSTVDQPKCDDAGENLLTCVDNVWTPNDPACEFGCADGSCKAQGEDPEYEPCDSTVDTFKCSEDGISLLSCSDTNFWVPQSCTFGCDTETEVAVCKEAGVCSSETDTEPACAPDTVTIVTCQSDVWVPGDVCPNGCEEGKCKDSGGDEPVACDSSTDQPKCEDDNITLTTCTDDVWVSASCLFGCEEGACKDPEACDAETDTDPKCALDEATILTCTENVWTAGDKCDYGCESGVCKKAEEDVCDPACENGQVCVEGECKDSDANACDSENDEPKCGGEGDAYVMTCTENQWTVAEEACPNGCEDGECIEEAE